MINQSGKFCTTYFFIVVEYIRIRKIWWSLRTWADVCMKSHVGLAQRYKWKCVAWTGSFHPLGELALEQAAFIHWASWRWNWKISSIGRVGAGTGSFHPLGEVKGKRMHTRGCFCLLFLKPGEGKSDGKDTVSGKAWVKGKTHAHGAACSAWCNRKISQSFRGCFVYGPRSTVRIERKNKEVFFILSVDRGPLQINLRNFAKFGELWRTFCVISVIP